MLTGIRNPLLGPLALVSDLNNEKDTHGGGLSQHKHRHRHEQHYPKIAVDEDKSGSSLSNRTSGSLAPILTSNDTHNDQWLLSRADNALSYPSLSDKPTGVYPSVGSTLQTELVYETTDDEKINPTISSEGNNNLLYDSFYNGADNRIDTHSNQQGSDYQQYDIVPFNTDQESDTPHFDADFFPEPVDSFDNSISSPFPNKSFTTGFNTSTLLDHAQTSFRNTTLSGSIDNGLFPAQNNQSNFSDYGDGGLIGDPNINLTWTNIFDNIAFDHGVYHATDYNSTFSPLGVAANVTAIFPGSNVTSNLTSSFSVDDTGDEYTWSILLMTPLVVFGVTGNTLVILAISLERRLQNVTNYFLLSLAVTDLLVSLIVMPFSIINVFTGRWLFGLLLCDFFVTSDVLMCTSSILHLCTISLERYIGIRYPLWTKNKSKRVVLLKIVLVWTIALAITSPITVLGVVKAENVLVDGKCNLNNEHFIIYGSIFAFFIPLTIMVLMYGLTVRMLNKQARLCQSRRADDGEGEPMIRRSISRRNWQGRRKFYGREGFSVPSSYYDSSGSIRGCGSVGGGGGGGSYDLTCMDSSSFHARYRPLSSAGTGVIRHNTIPVYHQRGGVGGANSGSGVGGGGGTSSGNNSGVSTPVNQSSILRRGRINNNMSSAANNNNINNSNNVGNNSHSILNNSLAGSGNCLSGTSGVGGGVGAGGGCGGGASDMSVVASGRRNRFVNHNGIYSGGGGGGSHNSCGGGGSGKEQLLHKSSSPEYPYCNGHQDELPSDASAESTRNCCQPLFSSSSSSSSPTSSAPRETKRLRELVRKHHVAVKAANILLLKRDPQSIQGQGPGNTGSTGSSTNYSVRRDNSVRTEQKASKVLGVVFMIFVVLWAPFFTVNILTALCTTCSFEPTLITAFVWLGYVSSTLNPIIYTIFNNIFRITFIKLLCCRYRLLHRARSSSHMTSSGLRNGLLASNAFCPTPGVNVSCTISNNMTTGTMIDESNC